MPKTATARVAEPKERKIPVFHDGDRLRKSRVEAGLTLIQLGDRVGLNDKTISSWERKAKFPTLARFAVGKLADACDVDEHWLKTGHAHQGPDEPCDLCARRDSNPQPSDPECEGYTRPQLRHLKAVA